MKPSQVAAVARPEPAAAVDARWLAEAWVGLLRQTNDAEVIADIFTDIATVVTWDLTVSSEQSTHRESALAVLQRLAGEGYRIATAEARHHLLLKQVVMPPEVRVMVLSGRAVSDPGRGDTCLTHADDPSLIAVVRNYPTVRCDARQDAGNQWTVSVKGFVGRSLD